MRLPYLNKIRTETTTLSGFGGYNHTDRASENEFYDMKNMSSKNYPLLSTRGSRHFQINRSNVQGMVQFDEKLFVVRDGKVYCVTDIKNNIEHSTKVTYLDPNGLKKMAVMGSYLIILPDKVWMSTINADEHGYIEQKVTMRSNRTGIYLCDVDGNEFTNVIDSDTEPQNAENMAIWRNTSVTPPVIRQYSKANGMWTTINPTYIKIIGPMYDEAGHALAYPPFRDNDGITISGLKDVPLIDEQGNTFEDSTISNIGGKYVAYKVFEDAIVIPGVVSKKGEEGFKNPITISRKMPDMDFVVESGNRLWGCKYGVIDDKGTHVNEIYASKLGDFKNWDCFMGISTDSYVASIGTDGPFTGAISYQGYPIFFKENYMHKVYGTMPSNYQVQQYPCKGVQRGSGDSLAVVDGLLLYQGADGVYAYDGSSPRGISDVFGGISYSKGVGRQLGNKYYLSTLNAKNEPNLLVYDVGKGLWHKEDNLDLSMSVSTYDDIVVVVDGTVITIANEGNSAIKYDWMVETGRIGMQLTQKKSLMNLSFRYSTANDTKATVFVEYDSSGKWEYATSLKPGQYRTDYVTIAPQRCDHFRVRIVGEGEAKFYSLTKKYMIRSGP